MAMLLLGGGGAAALLLLASTSSARPIPVYQPSIINTSTLPATRSALTARSVLANGHANGVNASAYKPWIAVLPSGELLVVGFCVMGWGPGDCTFANNGTASEHAIFWRSSDHGRTFQAEDRPDIRAREFTLTVLSDGTLLMPASDFDCTPGCEYPSLLFRSTDGGHQWSKLGLRLENVGWDHTRF
jgi:hypothetical protein